MFTLPPLIEEETIQRLLVRLKALRLGRGLTQERFAEESGISYKYYQAVEAGRKRDLRLSTLDRLAKAHGMDVWQLLLPGDGSEADSGAKEVPSTRTNRTKG
jgi:transcriptional regulator with XRE-family HTH domain